MRFVPVFGIPPVEVETLASIEYVSDDLQEKVNQFEDREDAFRERFHGVVNETGGKARTRIPHDLWLCFRTNVGGVFLSDNSTGESE